MNNTDVNTDIVEMDIVLIGDATVVIPPLADGSGVSQPLADGGAPSEEATPVVEELLSTPQAENGRVSEGDTTGSTPSLQHVASSINRMHMDRPKISGAQRRKRQAQRALERGEPIPARKRSKNKESGGRSVPPTPNTFDNSRTRLQSQFTPSTGDYVPEKKTCWSGDGVSTAGSEGPEAPATSSIVSSSQPPNIAKMVVVPCAFPKEKMVESCATMIKTFIFREVIKTPKGNPLPTFVKNSFEKGALILICRDDFTRHWLVNKVREIPLVLGIHLKVGLYRDLIPEYKGIFIVSKDIIDTVGSEDPKEIISLVGIQNPNLNAENIGIINIHKDFRGLKFIVSLDEESMMGVRESGYKISLGLEMIPIIVPEERRATKSYVSGPNKPQQL
ncbi:hypothetical protein M8J77_012145 [Diaphorina citri]|nr:hypothetical protein M8J77_012145 [Diaphorina citri]